MPTFKNRFEIITIHVQNMGALTRAGPFCRLVTANTAPEWARRLIGLVVEDVKDDK